MDGIHRTIEACTQAKGIPDAQRFIQVVGKRNSNKLSDGTGKEFHSLSSQCALQRQAHQPGMWVGSQQAPVKRKAHQSTAMVNFNYVFITQVDTPGQKLVDPEMSILFFEVGIFDLNFKPVDSGIGHVAGDERYPARLVSQLG